jgi:hypothetical protein
MIFLIIISFYSINHVANKKNKIIKIKENRMNERIYSEWIVVLLDMR